MTDLVFYDFDFKRLLVSGKYISVNFEVNYCGYGTFEAHFAVTESKLLEMLDENRYIICTYGDCTAVITGWQIGEDIAVFGRTPEWLLTKRCIKPFSCTSKTPEEIARYAVSTAMSDFATLGAACGQGEAQKFATETARYVFDVVREVLLPCGLGFRLKADTIAKQFVFEVYSGSEIPLVVSKSNRTSSDMLYTVDLQGMVTGSGWYERKILSMGEWDAASNSPRLTNSSTGNAYTFYKITSSAVQFGLSCTEGSYLYCDTADGVWKVSAAQPSTVWVYIDSSEASGARKWEAVLSGAKTESEATAEIKALKACVDTESETRRIELGADYALGDIVRLQFEFGDFKRTVRKRITGIDIFSDVDRCGVKPKFESLEE